ncbi:phage terminase large subunit [Oryzomonas japonica]|uniref:Phage terminase large subunit n=1 Tax=Oryzomonas japonica TaxID=2603858 RepID=A0A7J4ZR80_9BACT|nr:phage terminase large subunit [Oryzomonas japonica]KAB0665661.1 phage terminase large subunit [Oryzomonas japonica]
MSEKGSFPAFYLKWGELVHWDVPDVHLEACDWLEHGRTGRVAVFKALRGFSKSTIVGRYVSDKLRKNSAYRFQLLSATDKDGAKMSRDSQHVINRHPWCKGMRGKGGLWKSHSFEVEGSDDPRNPSVVAYGINSNLTGGRADEFINDDVEVPKTIRTPALREAIREKLSEETHILVPGGKILYVGTDHCVDSIYKEQIEDGADLLEIPLFRKGITHISKDGLSDSFLFDFRVQTASDLYVCIGINKPRLLGDDEYQVHGLRDFKGGFIKLKTAPAPDERVSIYSGNIWPKRFTRAEITFRIKRCRTWGEWDSQYMLKPAQLTKVRLDPARMIPYDAMPEIRSANGSISLWINGIRMVGAKAWWDCSLGKVNSDASALAVIFTCAAGYLYWQVAQGMTGEIDEQCQQVVPVVKAFQLRSIDVETNGPGGFVPAILRRHLKSAGLACAVVPKWSKQNKNLRILDALETPLSGSFLYAHQSVLQGPVPAQMREWDATNPDNEDDYLDAASGAISTTPVRIGNHVPPVGDAGDDWRPGSGTHEAQSDY